MAHENLSEINMSFVIEITHIDEVWIGECELLGLVAEAQSYEQLTKTCWLLLPDLLELNHFGMMHDKVCLHFEHIEYAEMG